MTNEVNKSSVIMTEQQFNASPLKSVMTYEQYCLNALKSGSAFTFNLTWNPTLTKNNTIFKFNTNPITEQKSQKEILIEKAANISDPTIRQQIIDGLNGTTSPSEAFYKMLVKKYDKQKEDFEVAWAEYQATKDNLAYYKKIFEILEKKYEGSESDYENSQVRHAKNDKDSATIAENIALDKAFRIAHKPTVLYFG